MHHEKYKQKPTAPRQCTIEGVRSRHKLTLSERMARIRKTDTKPEIAVRKVLHSLGYRFRLHRRDLPGNPDIVFASRHKIVFVHGCFWHQHDCKLGAKRPKSNTAYWLPKLQRNKDRDQRHLAALRQSGWLVMVVWECELSDRPSLELALRSFVG